MRESCAMLILVWALCSVVAGFAAGWVIGKYGHHEKPAPRQMLPIRVKPVNPELLAAEIARSNRLEIRR